MSGKSVSDWRRRRKNWLVVAFNKKCGICGYSKSIRALQFHHLDATLKEFSFSEISYAWDKVIVEAKKCVMLCSNCHMEVHDNITKIPKDIQRFDETLIDYSIGKVRKTHGKNPIKEVFYCPICNNERPKRNKYCSLKCAGIGKSKADWSNLLEMKKTMSNVDIAKVLNVSETAVRKQLKWSVRPTV